jgi:hypothetical protein
MRGFLLAAMLCAAFPARAQQDVDWDALRKAKPGASAEYVMSMKSAPDKPVKMRITLVEKTDKKLALEMNNDTPMGKIKARLEYVAEGTAWRLAGGSMTMGTTPPQPIPAEQVQAAEPIKKGGLPGKLVGTETVTTPAGTFKCQHYRNPSPQKWA